jgi:hypothetical protein
MLNTTATFSPRSLTTNWRSFPIGNSRRTVYSGVGRRTIGSRRQSVQTGRESLIAGLDQEWNSLGLRASVAKTIRHRRKRP